MSINSEISRINDEVSDQTGLISQIRTVLQTKSGGGGTLITKTITQNGTYNASSDNADGYSKVVVNVSGGGDDDYLPIGGIIFCDTYNVFGHDNGATYQFFDANKTEITYSSIYDLVDAVYYKVTVGVPNYDRFYVFDNTSHNLGSFNAVDGIVNNIEWGLTGALTQYDIINNDPSFCDKIGSGKALSALALARGEEEGYYTSPSTIWQYINECNAARLNGCCDWFILSNGEHDALRNSGFVSWYDDSYLWSSVEYYNGAFFWSTGYWGQDYKGAENSCFAARAF